MTRLNKFSMILLLVPFSFALVAHADSGGGGGGSGGAWVSGCSDPQSVGGISCQRPVSGALNVASTSDVALLFNRRIVATEANISFSPSVTFTYATSSASGYLSNGVSISTSDLLTITPTSPLSNNTTYTLTLSGIKDFDGNVLSTYTTQFTTQNNYSISLYTNSNSNLNLISLPVQPSNTAIASVLGVATSSIDSVWSYDPSNPSAPSSGWLVYYPAHPELSSLSTMNTGYGYWITAKAKATISGSGSLFTSTSTPPSRAVQSGWNLLGYYQLPGQNSSTATNAFSSISGYTTVVGYDNSTGVFKTVSSILPGNAFWLGIPSTGTYYPSYSFSSSSGGGTFEPPQATGTVLVEVASTSPSSNISLGATNVKWASFQMTASNEDIKIESLNIFASTTADHGLDNGKVFFNGVQVGSTKDLTDNADIEFTFGSSFILKKDVSAIIDIYADARTSTGATFVDGDMVTVSIGQGSANGHGQVTLSTINVPTSAVVANTISIVQSTMALSKYSGYGNQTMIAGTNNARLGSFTLSTGATEGVNINTLTVALSADEAATVTDLILKDNATGAQIGSTKASPSTSNAFSVNVAMGSSATKTIDIYGNIKSGSNAGPWIANIDASGTGAITGSTVDATALNLQTITLGTATLSAAAGVSPDNANVIAGASLVKVGSFNFTSQYSSFTVDQIQVKVPANAATSITSVTLRYPSGVNGVSTDSVATLALSSGSEVYSTATFSGLTFYIPADTTKKLDVYVSLATIASGATSGSAVSVRLGDDGGYRNTNSAGTVATDLASGDLNSAGTTGKGTMYVRKSIPTISSTPITTTLAEGTDQVLGRVTVSADAAGDVDWGSMVFTLNKTSALTIGATTTVKLWSGSNSIAGTFATTTGDLLGGLDSCQRVTTCRLHFRPTTVETVSAGGSKTYELRGTVGGTAAGNNSIDVSIANPQTTASSTAVFSSAAGAQGESTAASFAWSDWSDLNDHAAGATSGDSADWMGDYLVKTLPMTIGTRSVSINT